MNFKSMKLTAASAVLAFATTAGGHAHAEHEHLSADPGNIATDAMLDRFSTDPRLGNFSNDPRLGNLYNDPILDEKASKAIVFAASGSGMTSLETNVTSVRDCFDLAVTASAVGSSSVMCQDHQGKTVAQFECQWNNGGIHRSCGPVRTDNTYHR